VADLSHLEQVGSTSASSPTGFAPVHPLPQQQYQQQQYQQQYQQQQQQRNPLGPPPQELGEVGDEIYGDVTEDGFYSSRSAPEFDEEDALELEDEGMSGGVPPSYAISARRLGMSPEEVHSHHAYHRAGPMGASV
jgi:hypothetical protein